MLFVNDGNFSGECRTLLARQPAVGGAGSLSIEATQLATAGPPPPPCPCVRQSDLDCVMCHVNRIIVNTHYTKRKDE